MPQLVTSLNCDGRLVSFEDPQVMAIVNLSPDSFYAGSTPADGADALVERVGRCLAQGATFVDLGAASSKPGSVPVDEKVERARLVAALQVLRPAYPEALFSVDTYRSSVAEAALEHGACIVNDISGATADPAMWPLLAAARVPLIAMHRLGPSATMQDAPTYPGGVVETLFSYFTEVLAQAQRYNVDDVVLDPGFGFGKTDEHNFTLLARLQDFRFLRRPLLVGVSRKSMLCRTVGVTPEGALAATTAAHVLALQRGADILRVHDVREAVHAIQVFRAFRAHDPYRLPAVPLV